MKEIVGNSISVLIRKAEEMKLNRGDVLGIYPDSGGMYHLVYWG